MHARTDENLCSWRAGALKALKDAVAAAAAGRHAESARLYLDAREIAQAEQFHRHVREQTLDFTDLVRVGGRDQDARHGERGRNLGARS